MLCRSSLVILSKVPILERHVVFEFLTPYTPVCSVKQSNQFHVLWYFPRKTSDQITKDIITPGTCRLMTLSRSSQKSPRKQFICMVIDTASPPEIMWPWQAIQISFSFAVQQNFSSLRP
ncbi:hypothetical protein KC19_11G083000 [Ceratodon purpureus]|uniref:Uncharacterized protein n=1 Tax=Ceratodon purpureus TaxID=3225 RepID=A0A8T0GFB2_CERPU|nr:hypothetical protein KC19_11G083000 [Ceratodon purpureus]